MVPFHRVVDEHGAAVLAVCRAIVGPDDADDAWSDSFLSALRAYDGLRPDSDVRAWLTTIARNRSIDLLRRRSRTPRPTDDVPAIAAEGIPEPIDVALGAAVAALPPKQRQAVAYRYLADLPYDEVAQLLDCSVDAARRSAADGIAALRRRSRRGSEGGTR